MKKAEERDSPAIAERGANKYESPHHNFSALAALLAIGQGCVFFKKDSTLSDSVDHALRTPDSPAQLATPGPIKGTSVGSKYEGVRDLFFEGQKPVLERFDTSLAMAGKCAFRYDPQEFYPGFLNVYVEEDQILGKILFMVPLVQNDAKSRGDGSYFLKMSRRELGNIFGASKSEIAYFYGGARHAPAANSPQRGISG